MTSRHPWSSHSEKSLCPELRPLEVASRLEIRGDDFVLDGQVHRIISGSVSYFRVLPPQWRDRMEKLKALGCNAAEVYVPWNLHEPEPGSFDFEGRCDLPAFLELCQELQLDVLLRPGPYICAEWDFGGLPWWLLRNPDPVPLRSSDPKFLEAVERWWCGQLLPRIRPYLAANGGSIIAMQVENEYGYWGIDPDYLEKLRSMMLDTLGSECPLLFTSDGTFWPDLQANGGLDSMLRTANFGSEPNQRLPELRVAQPRGPLCNMEFWIGWFDAWGALTGKSFRDPKDVARTLRGILDAGASVNFFVFHGGTSFGFCGPGGNVSQVGQYEPQVTSYDYGGLLDEAGEITTKYLRCREVLADFLNQPELLERSFPKTRRLPESPLLEIEASLSLEQALPCLAKDPVKSAVPLAAEQVGLGYGYILYRSQIPASDLPLTFGDDVIRDFASVLLEGRVLGTIYRNDSGRSREFQVPQAGRLEVLVEMMGRVNFGPALLQERKGLVGPGCVQLGTPFTGPLRAVLGWDIFALPMDEESLAQLPWDACQGTTARKSAWERGPRFFRYSLHVQQPADGFLALEGFTKGFACVNGFNLGRYWQVGPQQTLYIPYPVLRRGQNEVLVFDIDSPELEEAQAPPAPRIVSEAIWSSGVLPRGAKEAAAKVVLRLLYTNPFIGAQELRDSLWEAALNSQTEVVRSLLEFRVDPACKPSSSISRPPDPLRYPQWTPLVALAASGSVERAQVVAELLSAQTSSAELADETVAQHFVKDRAEHPACPQSDFHGRQATVPASADGFSGAALTKAFAALHPNDMESYLEDVRPEELESLESRLEALLYAIRKRRQYWLERRLESAQRKHDEACRGRQTLEEEQCCVVCSEFQKTVLFMPCRHLCTCRDCAAPLQLCPICRTSIEEKLHCIQP
ncbi:GLB1 [Symbiodinium sp. KB8]|nr:GLB1 [Symbiodinium sp. KB8]